MLKTDPEGPPIYNLFDGADTSGDAEFPLELEMSWEPAWEGPTRFGWIGEGAPTLTVGLEEIRFGFAEIGNRIPPFLVQWDKGGVDEVEESPTLKITYN